MRKANAGNRYDNMLKAFNSCGSVIHIAAITKPVDEEDWHIHNNNIGSTFISFQAAAEPSLKLFCYKSSVNAISLWQNK